MYYTCAQDKLFIFFNQEMKFTDIAIINMAVNHKN